MRQHTHHLRIETQGQGLYEITVRVGNWIEKTRLATGLLTLFIEHTTASLLIQENADPDVQQDLDRFLKKLVPEDSRFYWHKTEGDDDMPAHIRSALTQTHLSIPIVDSRLALGAWQGIYVFEHRRAAHERTVALHAFGD